MNLERARPAADHTALARDLLRRAITAFASVAPDDRGPALAALDSFLAAPGPASYLAAARLLADARQARALRQVRGAHADRAFARGIETVRYELGAQTAELLAAVPMDERSGLRLRALALLAAAHRELAERVAGSTEMLRRQLAHAQESAPPAPPRRRAAAKSGRRRPAVARRRRPPA